MERIKYRMSLDMFEVASQTTIKAKKGDTACSIYVTLTENGKIYHIVDGCHAVFSGKKPDGNYLFNSETCRIEDNTIIYDFTKQTTPIEGIVECELILYKGEDKLTSPRFNLKVDSTVYNGEDIVSTPEADALKDLTDRAENVVAQFDEGVIVGKEYVDNNFANALKGSTSGKVISIKDISPISHQIKVKAQGVSYKNVTVLDGEMEGGVLDFDEPISNLVLKSKTPIKSYEGIAFYTDQDTQDGGTADEIFSVYEDCYWYVTYSNNILHFYFYRDAELTDLIYESAHTQAYPDSKIMRIEKWGEDALNCEITTETPVFGDYPNASVKVYGKNLFNNDTSLIQKYSFKISATGSLTPYYGYVLNLPAGKYRASGQGKKEDTTGWIYGVVVDKDDTRVGDTLTFAASTTFAAKTFNVPEGCSFFIYYSIKEQGNDTKAVATFSKFNIQIEAGSTDTEYEPYKEPMTYVADENGNINIPSQYEPMTLISDDDVELSAEYNRDINKAFAEIQQVIAQLQTLAVATVPMNEDL